uniref:Uncharacterized protein n=1 Tax=Amphimedon queenslandica TaxID=400682 RepID=A0A1X7TZ76_AMPQE
AAIDFYFKKLIIMIKNTKNYNKNAKYYLKIEQ